MLYTCMIYLQDYPKLSKSYYGMLEVLTQDHMEFISSLEPDVFVYILSSISEGLTGIGQFCATVEPTHKQPRLRDSPLLGG